MCTLALSRAMAVLEHSIPKLYTVFTASPCLYSLATLWYYY